MIGVAATDALSTGYRLSQVLEFHVLGPLEVVDEHGPIRLGGPRQRATLAILLLNANRVVSVEALADHLYAGALPVTAVTQVQRQISELRKALDPAAIETRPPGYILLVSPDQVDLVRFERTVDEALHALEQDDTPEAAELLRAALELWRGPPLADLAYEPFAATWIERLEELRLVALEHRIEADLRLGRHAAVIVELEELVHAEPFRERLQGQLMLALYRSGRQADALDAYRRARSALVDAFGIEPTPALNALQRAILTQDSTLELRRPAARAPYARSEHDRAMLVVAATDEHLDDLLTVAEPLGSRPGRELIIARLLTDESEFAAASSALYSRRSGLKTPTRTAAFTSLAPAVDIVRLATSYDVDLVLMDTTSLDDDRLSDDLAAILERSPADVALLSTAFQAEAGDELVVPFGGGEHDWAALELAAWLGLATNTTLRLIGTSSDPVRSRRDASALLADASLAVQRVAGLESDSLLVDASIEALTAAIEPAALIVVGISPRWRREGIGTMRSALVRGAHPPVFLVHAGPRPSGLAPPESRSRFSWSIEA